MTDNEHSSFTNSMADALKKTIDHKTIFSDPIKNDEITIIPVSRVRYAFGGGEGHKKQSGEEGQGSGGAVMAEPVGYIEMNKGQSSFKKIASSPSWPKVILASGVTGLLLLKGLRGFFKRK